MTKPTTRSVFKYLLLALLLAAGLCGTASGPRKGSDEARMKAAYLFLEAENRLYQGDPGTAYHMLRRAATLDPTDIGIAGALGEIVLRGGVGDSTAFEKAYDAVRRRFTENPADFQSGEIFADLARQWQRFDDVRDTYGLLREKHPSRPDYTLEYAWFRALDYTDGDTTAVADAMDILDRIEAGTGTDADITLHRLRALSVAADTTAMVGCIRRYLATAPADAQVNYAVGQMYGLIHMPDSSLLYYSRACDLDSTMGAAYLARAEQMLAAGDSAGYDREVVRALESPTLEFAPKLEILTNYTRALYQDEDRHKGISQLFGRMLDIHPGEAELHNLYGAYLATVDSAAGACEQFGYAMDLDPDDEEYPQFRLQTALAANDTLTAIETARMATSRFDNMAFPVTAAQILYSMGRSADALAMLDSAKLSAQDNNNALSVYYTFRGDLQHALERNDSAFVDYERAIALNPQNVGALNNLAYFMAVDGVELDKAENYIRQALVEEPLNPTYIDTYAWVLFKKKDYTGARKQIDDVLAIYDTETDTVIPDTVAVDSVMPQMPADSAANAEEPALQPDGEETVEIYEPETPSSEIYDHAGDIYFMTGDNKEALEFWKKALELDPGNEKIKKKVKHKTYFFD